LDFLEKNADQTEEWWSSSDKTDAAGGGDEDEAMEGVVQGDVEAKVSSSLVSIANQETRD
jgi:hypothetical protein